MIDVRDNGKIPDVIQSHITTKSAPGARKAAVATGCTVKKGAPVYRGWAYFPTEVCGALKILLPHGARLLRSG